MRIQPLTVHCKKCKHQWDAETVVGASVKLWGASVQETVKAGCPACHAPGKGNILMGAAPVLP